MKVLFVGGTGTISLEVSKLCTKKEIDLFLLNRGSKNDELPKDVNIIQADISNIEDVKQKIKGMKFDVVVDWIIFEPEQAKRDIELFKNKCRQFIFISSASAYNKPVQKYLVTEDTPMKNPYWNYSQKKIECENIFMEAYRKEDFPVTIVRPSHTYDSKTIPFIFNSHKDRWSIVERIIENKEIVIPGDGTNFWVLTHSRDFAKGFVGLFLKSQAIGEAFNIVSDEVLTWNEITKIIAKTFDAEVKFCHISSQTIIDCLPEQKGPLFGDKSNNTIIDNSKIKKLVPEFKPEISFSLGMEMVKEWFDEHPEEKKLDKKWDRLCDKFVEARQKTKEYFLNI